MESWSVTEAGGVKSVELTDWEAEARRGVLVLVLFFLGAHVLDKRDVGTLCKMPSGIVEG